MFMLEKCMYMYVYIRLYVYTYILIIHYSLILLVVLYVTLVIVMWCAYNAENVQKCRKGTCYYCNEAV